MFYTAILNCRKREWRHFEFIMLSHIAQCPLPWRQRRHFEFIMWYQTDQVDYWYDRALFKILFHITIWHLMAWHATSWTPQRNKLCSKQSKIKIDSRTSKLGINICANDISQDSDSSDLTRGYYCRITPTIYVQNKMNLNLKMAA